MQIILASAKIMNSYTNVAVPIETQPLFKEEARQMALEIAAKSVDEIADLLHCNTKIALENKLRFENFLNEEEYLPALLAYYGQAYKCLKADSFSEQNMLFAQEHLWITSFLYGLLRPLDRIHPYRMEGKVRLKGPTDSDETRFEFWKARLTDILIDAVKADDGILVHLATEEFQHLFDWKRIKQEVTVIQPLFMVEQGDKLKTVSVYAKSCRGAMTRYIIKNRLSSPEQLQSFEYDGFCFAPNYGDAVFPHFILKQ